MTYLKRSQKVQHKVQTHRIGLAKCELAYAEIITEMQEQIEILTIEIANLKDELRSL